jgi:adenylate cyclase
MNRLLNKTLTWLVTLAVDPGDDQRVRLKKAILSCGWIGTVIFLSFVVVPIYAWIGVSGIAVIFAYVVWGLASMVLYALWHRNANIFAYSLAVGAIPLHLGFVSWAGGFLNAGGMPIWVMFFPALGMLTLMGSRQGAVWFAVSLATFCLSLFVPVLNPAPAPIPTGSALAMLAINFALISILIFGFLSYFIRQREQAFALLEGEQQRSENLLLNILPKEIAAILKREPRTIAEHYEGASILFADVVNFTPMSAQMTPVELVELLNEVFSHFDGLVDRFGLEKIKTIGDCYMVAAGVPRPRADHAQATVGLALAMRDYVGSREFHGRKIAFRIGVNSGPVVAGVIGRKKFIYDLWGDAVNTASRMESHGTEGSIQITRSTFEAVRDAFVCVPRGLVPIKGKGEMEIWHVAGPAASAA